ncbi:enoyl-CoA hydratase-related protein [Aliiglaciecola sp.]|nr:enoyl-CoA hydratase-related protein [Aliiglaciecola sp.]
MKYVLSEQNNSVLKLTIDRVAQKNAINAQMYGFLADELERANADEQIHSVLISAAGDIFTAGNDLQDFLNPPKGDELPAVRFLYALAKSDKPLVAAVNGPAIGIGLTLLLHCDIAICADSASFVAPFAKLGLVPEAASSLLLPRIVGRSMANDILLSGRTLNAQEALQCGLVSRVVDLKDLAKEAQALVETLANMPQQAMGKSKALINRDARQEILDKMQQEFIDFDAQLASDEFKRAVAPLLKPKTA